MKEDIHGQAVVALPEEGAEKDVDMVEGLEGRDPHHVVA